MTTPLLRNLISRSPLRLGLLLIALACFGFSPTAPAVSPKPDGGYPGGNTAEGDSALQSLTIGTNNTAIGWRTLYSNTFGYSNTAIGFGALYSNMDGAGNTAAGSQALYSNRSGNDNTAVGYQALYNNTTGYYNTATGDFALFYNTIGNLNTATGFQALTGNTSGNDNTANGYRALLNNTTGNGNTASGSGALYTNSTGVYNTATGWEALYGNTTGYWNTATGVQVLSRNTTGTGNTANGYGALEVNYTGNNNTANGSAALSYNTIGGENTADGSKALLNNSGNGNTALGYLAGSNLTYGDGNIDIGNAGVADESNTIRIGVEGTQTATFIAGIANAMVTGSSAVFIDTTTGQLGLMSSSERFKDAIEPMGNASEALLSLRPVTFRYKKNIDPKGAPQFGLVAEEVEKVNPALVVREPDGKVFTVRYEAVNAMLLNEFLKAHRKMEEQQATIAQLESAMAHQQKQIEALTTGLHRVTEQLEVTKPATKTVVNTN